MSAKSRRQFLRGAGVALALPWMESLPLLGSEAGCPAKKAREQASDLDSLRSTSPTAWNRIHWWAKGSGASMDIGPGLAPMMPYREDFTFLRGPIQPARGRLHQPAPRPDAEPAVRRDRQPRSERHTRRNDLRPGSCEADRRSRQRYRAWYWVSSRTNSDSKTASR